MPGRTLVKTKLSAAVDLKADVTFQLWSFINKECAQQPTEDAVVITTVTCRGQPLLSHALLLLEKALAFTWNEMGLSPRFSTSLVTTPFLAFIDNDIFLCSLSPTHATGRQGQLLYFKRLERKCRDLQAKYQGTQRTQIRFQCHLGLVKIRERKNWLCVLLLLTSLPLSFFFPWLKRY